MYNEFKMLVIWMKILSDKLTAALFGPSTRKASKLQNLKNDEYLSFNFTSDKEKKQLRLDVSHKMTLGRFIVVFSPLLAQPVFYLQFCVID